jgi:hypothetical protein
LEGIAVGNHSRHAEHGGKKDQVENTDPGSLLKEDDVRLTPISIAAAKTGIEAGKLRRACQKLVDCQFYDALNFAIKETVRRCRKMR